MAQGQCPKRPRFAQFWSKTAFGVERPAGPGFKLLHARAGQASADCFREVTNTTTQPALQEATFLTPVLYAEAFCGGDLARRCLSRRTLLPIVVAHVRPTAASIEREDEATASPKVFTILSPFFQSPFFQSTFIPSDGRRDKCHATLPA